ncbi:unnamed protein product, partial [marine sediment metagenome]
NEGFIMIKVLPESQGGNECGESFVQWIIEGPHAQYNA